MRFVLILREAQKEPFARSKRDSMAHQKSHYPHRASGSRHLLLGLSALAFIVVLVVFTWRRVVISEQLLPVLGTVPNFSLIDAGGAQVGLADLRGHVWVVDFIFTNCAGTCPIMTTAMSELQSEITKRGMDNVRLVSISVDPERDTPDVLARFAEGYGADRRRWYFLTGNGEAIQQLANKGFRLSAAIGGSEDEPIIHSNRFVLVDRQAAIRGYYDGTDEKAVRKLLRDLVALSRTRKTS